MRFWTITLYLMVACVQYIFAQNPIEAVIDKQLAAYNAHNIDAFAACYSKDVVVYTFPDKEIMKGIEMFRSKYAQMFQSSPKIKAEVVSRVIEGNYVIDKEKLSGFPRQGEVEITATAIYEVKDGLIQKVWFISSR